jgi:hypothetical protein
MLSSKADKAIRRIKIAARESKRERRDQGEKHVSGGRSVRELRGNLPKLYGGKRKSRLYKSCLRSVPGM